MPAALRIELNPEELRTLLELRQANTVPQRTRDRAHILILNDQGWSTVEIAKIFICCEHKVRSTLKRWQDNGLGGLWEAKGRGAKRRWQEADINYLEQCLEQDARTYNSKQLAQKLVTERNLKLSPRQLRRILKKRGIDGREHVMVNEQSKTPSPEKAS